MEDIKIIISNNISELRRKNNLTQLELAEKLNYSDKSISKWERGESVPDVLVLKEMADMFDVSVDYFLTDSHNKKQFKLKQKTNNKKFVTAMSIMLVWLIATLVFVIVELIPKNTHFHFLSFVYAVAISFIVWLVFNSIWFNRRLNFVIISLLMWSVLGCINITLLMFSINTSLTFVLGIPGQIIILLWSRIKIQKK